MFRLNYDGASSNTRFLVALTGIIATWWVGLIIGIIFGIVALTFNNWRDMLKYSLKGIGITMIVTTVTGLLGFAYGWLTRNHIHDEVFYLYDFTTIDDPAAFHIVGCIHNFSYFGAGLGLVIAIIYIIRNRRKHKTESTK